MRTNQRARKRPRRPRISPTKPGYGKGCFGSLTREARKDVRTRESHYRARAYGYARSYVTRRRSASANFDHRMKDRRRFEQEIERVAQKRIETLRAKDSEKRTTRAQKV